MNQKKRCQKKKFTYWPCRYRKTNSKDLHPNYFRKQRFITDKKQKGRNPEYWIRKPALKELVELLGGSLVILQTENELQYTYIMSNSSFDKVYIKN